MEKILTISIAAYNMEKYIVQTLESLIIPDIIDELEIFVIDDGGSDRTLEIAKQYAEQYPKSIFPIHKENGGYGSTINYSIQYATGKYFKQLDGDDWFNKENMKEFVRLLKENDADCITSSSIIWRERGGETEVQDCYSKLEEGFYQLESRELSTVWLNMYSLTFKTKVLQDMGLQISEKCFYTDLEYIIRSIPYVHTVYVWHKTIYIYRVGRNGQSMSAEGIMKHYKEHEEVLWNNIETYTGIYNEFKKAMIKIRLMSCINEHFRYLCYFPYSREKHEELRNFKERLQCEYPKLLKDTASKYEFTKLCIFLNGELYPLMRFIMYLYLKGYLVLFLKIREKIKR